jgi:Ser/Thr protein kinase RdoA (MazF antagonist)
MLWLSDLRRTMRLPVPEPVAMLDGSLVGNVYTGDVPAPRKFAFVLLRWVPGEEKLNDFSVPEAFSLGSYIAKLHRHAEQYPIPEDFVRPRWDWQYMFGSSSPLWSVGPLLFSEEEMEVLKARAEWVRRDLQYIGESRDAFGIIHSDLHPGNLLNHEGILYALDFDHCGWGYYMYDLTMSYMGLGRFGARSEEMGEALFKGYQHERPIPRDHLERFETFRTMCLAARVIPAFARLKNVPPEEFAEHPMWKVGGLQKNMKALVSGASSS